MKLLSLVCLLVLASPAHGSAQDPSPDEQAPETKGAEERAPEEEAEPESSHVYWDDGLWVLGWYGKMRMKIGGQAQNDTAGFVANGTQPVEIQNGVEWRRARVYALGTFGKRLAFKLQWDLARAAAERVAASCRVAPGTLANGRVVRVKVELALTFP